RRRASSLVDLGKAFSTGLEVVVPAEPATVTSIDIHDHIGEIELLESIGNTLFIALLGVLAGLQVDVGNQVRERIGFNNKSEGSVGKLLKHSADGCKAVLARVCNSQRSQLTINVLSLVPVEGPNG